ncbi:MAG: hypothetical protein A2W00_11595 [Candidatus Eisenbacteria bacterium RBG_16_71_46]|nr:MAG: hypothetical protein A2W00_11595 [Candidatus Eisenbacteria bacterium RBG_16_71_46]
MRPPASSLGLVLALGLLVLPALISGVARAEGRGILGRWDLTLHTAHRALPAWFEIADQGGTLGMRYVGWVGGARPVSRLEYSDRQIRFSLPTQFERPGGTLTFTGRFNGAWLEGEGSLGGGPAFRWTAVRSPGLAPRPRPRWGEPIALFDGRDLDGWCRRHEGGEACWGVEDGVLSSQAPCVDLVSRRRFRDFRLHVEFRLAEGADSGIHLRGRYEIQLRDDNRMDPAEGWHAGLYGFIAPASDARRPAGEWQTCDATLIGRRVTVVMNGVTVIDDQEIPGITGDALDSDEGAAGPIMLQGRAGGVSFRDITVVPAR